MSVEARGGGVEPSGAQSPPEGEYMLGSVRRKFENPAVVAMGKMPARHDACERVITYARTTKPQERC